MKSILFVLILVASGCIFNDENSRMGNGRDTYNWDSPNALPKDYVLHLHDINQEWNHALGRLEGNFTLTSTRDEPVDFRKIRTTFQFQEKRDKGSSGGKEAIANFLDDRTLPPRWDLTLQPYESRVFNFSVKPDVDQPFEILALSFDIRLTNNRALFYNNVCLDWNGEQFVYNVSLYPADSAAHRSLPPVCHVDRYYYGGYLASRYHLYWDETWPPEVDEEFWSKLCPHCYGQPDPRHHVVYDEVEPYCRGDVVVRRHVGCGYEDDNIGR